ncbi:MAG: peptidyl-prolyl cis-trans isomerase [Polyangiaceae bacterium]|nr:peptidyl-prolyl cis-trans isomerase [Polyangiaceae bacterium]
MRRGTLLVLPLATLLFLAHANTPALAQLAGQSDRVVARVGDAIITVGDLERRIARVPPFQLASFGRTPEEAKRAFLERVLIPEVLLARGAQEQGSLTWPEVRARQRELLKSALQMRLQRQLSENNAVSRDQVAAYYRENATRFSTPARISIWRILVGSREEAEAIIRAAKDDSTPQNWTALAQSKSLDESTKIRGGNLGFVTSDGVGADGRTRVDVSVVAAAGRVRDGEIVQEPVPEGSGFAVVWRRGSMPAVNRTLEQEASTIEKLLTRQRAKDAEQKLLEELRARHLSYADPSGAELVEVSAGGQVSAASKPGRVFRRVGRTTPLRTAHGLR